MKGAAAYACLVSLCAATFVFIDHDIVDRYYHGASDASRTANDTRNRASQKKVVASSDSSGMVTKDVIDATAAPVTEKLSSDVKRKSKRKIHFSEDMMDVQAAAVPANPHTNVKRMSKRKAAGGYNYHDNAVFITHYHKTGYVLSRELMFLLQEIEVDVHRPDLKRKFQKHIQHEVSGVDEETGERFAFDQIGNWARSAFSTRKHSGETQCPFPISRNRHSPVLITGGFRLRDSTIYVQESPDLYCSDDDILFGLGSSHKGGTKIIHFVRNPYEMVLSNYFYHAQDPTPEKWVHRDDPCEHFYDDGDSLASHILPTLASELNMSLDWLSSQIDEIGSMCRDLFRSKRSLKDATFYDHLLELDKYDGLRLASAQMIAASGMSNGYFAGGDILRMANNLVRFKQLKEATEQDGKIEVYTVTMGDFIRDMANSTYNFLNFVFGEDDTTIPKETLWEAAKSQEEKYGRKKDRAHVTQTNEEDQRIRSMLKDMLRVDPHLSFILNMTEDLVNNALAS